MKNNNRSSVSPQIVLGIIIIFIGSVFLLDNFDIIYAGSILRYWPALLIVYGISNIAQSRHMQGQIFGWIFTAVGTMMLLDRLDFITFRVWDWWPVILIIIGLNFLRGSLRNKNKSESFVIDSDDSSSYVKNVAMLSGIKRTITSKEFRGGEITTIMGGCEIDLREAEMKENEAAINVDVVMGGVELRVPMGWAIAVEATPIMGGIEDKTYQSKEGSSKTLVISGSVIMGGVEIKN